MEYTGVTDGNLRFRAEIPVLYFQNGRYIPEIRIKEKTSGQEFIYHKPEDPHTHMTVGKAGFIRMHSRFMINESSYKYAIRDFQKIQKFLPHSLEGLYSSGFCSDEYLSMEELSLQIWSSSEADKLAIKMYYSIDGREFNERNDFIIADDSRNGKLLYDGVEYHCLNSENPPLAEYSIRVNAGINDILGQLSYEMGSTHDLRYYVTVSSGDFEVRFPETGYVETYFKVVDSPLGADCQASLLPIDLLVWDAVIKEKKVYFKWITAHESNNEFFEIERSYDAVNWNSKEKIPGKGNSNDVNHYYYVDNLPLPGISYYRLKQTDFDGVNKFSKTKIIRNFDNDIIFYPNPVSVFLHYSVVDPGNNYFIQIFTSSGQLVESHTVPEFALYENKINLQNLEKGIYILKYINMQNFHSRVIRLVKL
jgi:hypothetical protein